MKESSSLLDVFWRSFGGVARSDAPPELEAVLVALVDRWRAEWPEFRLEPPTFVRYFAERLPPDVDLSALPVLHAGDLYLACACARGTLAAIDVFDRLFLARVPEYLARMNEPAWFADDVRQLVREKLLVSKEGGAPRIADYSGRAPLQSWLRVVTLRMAVDLARSRKRDSSPPVERHAEAMPAGADPELDYLQARYRSDFQHAIREAMSTLSSQERNILRLHLIDGLQLDRIGALYGMSKATVWRRVQGYRVRLLQQTHAALRERLALGESSLETLMRVLRSHLDVSLQGFLEDG